MEIQSGREVTEWVILGRKIGTASGFDGDIDNFMLHDFQPVPELAIPAGCVGFDFNEGIIQTWDNDGIVTWSVDMIEALKHLPKVQS